MVSGLGSREISPDRTISDGAQPRAFPILFRSLPRRGAVGYGGRAGVRRARQRAESLLAFDRARTLFFSNVTDDLASMANAQHKKRGRRPTHAEKWTKVTVVLMDRQVVFLDRLDADVRAATGAAISRAHIIRSLVDALGESDLDLTICRSEADLKSLLTGRLRR